MRDHTLSPTTPANTKIGRLLHTTVTARATSLDPVARHAAIENALSMALWHLRHGSGSAAIHAATGRAIRAASMLKQASAETGGVL